MPLKVTWKKGMRLSTEVFDALDVSTDENIRLSNIIATGGRFGLIPWSKPFELSVNVSNSVLEVVSLSCHGVTRSGRIVDIEFDSNYTHTFDTRIPLSSTDGNDGFFLVVKFHDRQWREVNEMYSEPKYTFELLGSNSPIDDNSLPIGRLVYQYGWRLDETEFVPPCLYTDAHPKFRDQVNRAKVVLKTISGKCLNSHNCVARHLLGSFWTAVEDNRIFIDKKQDALSPADLFASVQKVVAAFVIGCWTEEHISLDHAEMFATYYLKPYDADNLFRDINEGLQLCEEISVKMDAVLEMTEVREEPPVPVEKPKPKPQPKPEPKPAGRNRWDGLEI